ncbi:hypothetical protein SAZ_42230 [Streptomyces noursei ZPM]|uniref:DUF4158 domain-containing protein n=1 Tax=Streptomyces noursei TaxID=1971 RepID=A0A401QPR1_STRNR|nr:DUF4158 domain-containing protein [Streptomyces noursei]AKA09285.1 hypothetical protein SAZ_42230 [Streptomyces noursei ZPM]EPY92444.1 hypothetical protein K530_53225 [Streptomyces noursei CCRC 11814]EXU91252.1 hypothetical protein P354_07375 [Streptomyces noursei PD-1]UWS76857.1 DUF4158 domain-containing protein [Streptomyces noursei]GCB87376.1 hypothetical protein SALB_00027 [Streptomyces noursei]
MTSIERTAYPRFKRLITAHELHLFFSPTRDELEWAAGTTDADEHLLALLLMVSRADRTAKHHRGLVRKRVGVAYDQAEARRIAEQSIRKEAAAKNRPADLINIALEKVVEAGLELPGFSTFDKMASKIRTEVNASICVGIHDRMSPLQRSELLRLLEERDNQAHGVAGQPRRQRGVDERRRRTEDHRLRRGGGRAGAAGLHAGQAPRADRVPGPQGHDARP